jgi:hypothetical protein
MSGVRANWVVFAGPTLRGIGAKELAKAQRVDWRPPIRRGDMDRLVALRPTAQVAIVDGLFHQSLSVGHMEIRRAIERGWTVWGLASMGAIRAYEMRDFGMRGFGRIYDCFLQEEDFRDDEVALLHEPTAPYRASSEPLVHIRVALEDLVRTGVLGEVAARAVVAHLASLWFGDRTLPLVRDLVHAAAGPAAANSVARWLVNFNRYRIKSHDLVDFLTMYCAERRRRRGGASC